MGIPLSPQNMGGRGYQSLECMLVDLAEHEADAG